MQYAIGRPSGGSFEANTDFLEANKLRWLKFGNDYFCYTLDPDGTIAWEGLDGHRFSFKDTASHAKGKDLFLVVQEGRLFQRAHPEIQVLYDKGRYLAVLLDRRQAARIAAHPARFAIRPVTKNETIFDRLQRPLTPHPIDPGVRRIVDSIDPANFGEVLTELASFPTRHSLSGHFRDAAKRTRDRLQLMGYDVRLQDVALPGGTTLNIVADRKGEATGDRSVTLVTAHLDSINHQADHHHSEDPTAPAPGADDNGSGSSGVVEIARVFKDQPIRQDLRLILFGGEEQGLFGSKRYLGQLPTPERARITAVVNMDMIAVVNTKSPTVLLEGGDPVSKAMISELAAAAHSLTQLEVNTSLEPHDSDHVPFINAGVPALLAIEGNDDANHNIHSANDTLDHIDRPLAVAILRMVTGFVAGRVGV
jgi:hypothetical protein